MKVIDKREEFIEYAKNHSRSETAEHFNICKAYASLLRKQWCGIYEPRVLKTKDFTKSEFIKFKKSHTASETANHYNISKTYVYKLCLRYGLTHYKSRTGDYIKNGHDIVKEFPVFAKEHTNKECAEYFGVSKSLIRWWCEKYSVECKTKVKNLKQVARNLYILDNGTKLYYFTNTDDIAEFVGLTRTRVNVLINKEHKIHQYYVRKEKITSYRDSGGAVISK